MSRIQVVIDKAEREAFRAQAEREGRSLSEWLREAGRERLAQARPARLDTAARLDAFFAEINLRPLDEPEEDRPEDDWEDVKERLASSKVEGLPSDA